MASTGLLDLSFDSLSGLRDLSSIDGFAGLRDLSSIDGFAFFDGLAGLRDLGSMVSRVYSTSIR